MAREGPGIEAGAAALAVTTAVGTTTSRGMMDAETGETGTVEIEIGTVTATATGTVMMDTAHEDSEFDEQNTNYDTLAE